QAWWEVGGERTGHDRPGAASTVERLGQGNSWLGLSVETSVSPAADAWHAPIETVSNSEAGFERVYQGSALFLSWLVRLPAGETWSATIEHRATVAVDRAAERGAPGGTPLRIRQPAACAPRADEEERRRGRRIS